MSPGFKNRKRRDLRNMRAFESRTQVWRAVGLAEEIDRQKTKDARRAGVEAVITILLLVGVLIVFGNRQDWFPDAAKAIRYGSAAAVALLGWLLARTLAQSLQPALFRRMEPGTAGTVGFLIRLVTIVVVVIAALKIAGVRTEALAVGGAFTAVVLGLAAQQTLAHVFAGMVLQTTRPFKVGDRIKLRGGSMAGEVDGIVSQMGLLYTTLLSGGERAMIPNNVIMTLTVVPIAEPERVELKAKFNADVTPQALQRMIEKAASVPLNGPPNVQLEELSGDTVTMSIRAVPLNPADGPKLSSDILAAVRDSDLDGRPDAFDLPTDP
jgi:small conductance mechanosensitive channel